MIECKYKCELDDCVQSAKYVYKSQKRKQDKVIAILIPILMACMVAMLIFDIVTGKSFVWDIVLLSALVILQVMYLIIPVMLVKAQKKAFKKMLINRIQQYIKRSIHHEKVEFIPGLQGCFHIPNSISVFHCIKETVVGETVVP